MGLDVRWIDNNSYIKKLQMIGNFAFATAYEKNYMFKRITAVSKNSKRQAILYLLKLTKTVYNKVSNMNTLVDSL